MSEAAAERADLSFASGGETCAAWFYRPPGEGPHPVVVMAHGFAGTRKARLGAYAERFRAAGLAALVFDYRYFGDSSGEPRQLISIKRQLEDWRAAIAFARTLEGVDPDRVALWGSSFSGGHVVGLAAEDPRISAVISQAPFADGPSTLKVAGLPVIWRLTVAGLRDLGRAIRGREPYRIPAVARPGEAAAISQPGSLEGYLALFDDPADFRNEYCARVGLLLGGYMPSRKAAKVRCPLLVVTCAGDAITPAPPARRMAERAPRGRSIEYEARWQHFDIYVGELFERTIADQVGFLQEHLLPAPAVASTG